MSFVFVKRFGPFTDDIEGISLRVLNQTGTQSEDLQTTADVMFWLCVIICLLMGIFSTFGNGLVIYISSRHEDFGGFRGVNWVVRNLAISDCLFGCIGCPLTIVFWCWGKKITVRYCSCFIFYSLNFSLWTTTVLKFILFKANLGQQMKWVPTAKNGKWQSCGLFTSLFNVVAAILFSWLYFSD